MTLVIIISYTSLANIIANVAVAIKFNMNVYPCCCYMYILSMILAKLDNSDQIEILTYHSAHCTSILNLY
jgi:hypothetical protein